MITVFYDGKCGLCRREIAHYQAISPQSVFHWVDITVNPSAIEQLGVQYADGLKRLHAQDAQGHLSIGVDAFLLIWRQLPRWRILAKIVGTPGIRSIAKLIYTGFAAWRFRRLSHCQVAIKATHTKNLGD